MGFSLLFIYLLLYHSCSILIDAKGVEEEKAEGEKEEKKIISPNISTTSDSSESNVASIAAALFEKAQSYRFGNASVYQDVKKAIKLLKKIVDFEATSSPSQKEILDSVETSNTLDNVNLSPLSILKSKALFSLGEIYEFGLGGITKDFIEARKFYNLSASLGNADAQQALGFLWATGRTHEDHTVDKPLSLLYYVFSASGGNMFAEQALANKYWFGIGVGKSCAKAVEKYEVVAEKVVDELRDKVTGWLGGGLQLSVRRHRSSIAETARLSEVYENSRNLLHEEEDIVQFYEYSAEMGDPFAQITMGTLYLHGGYGVDQDYSSAFRYFQQAAAQGDPVGLASLGYMYSQGLGTERDNATAIRLYKEAVDKGNVQAQTNLGYMYMHGYGVRKSILEAFRYFKMAADQGYAEGQLNLGTLYFNGEGVQQDYAKALSYFSLAAQQGNLIAIYNLGYMHQYGLGTAVSCPLAVQLYKRVTEHSTQTLQLLEDAYTFFERNDWEEALHYYERAAELGLELAQSNAAWLHDHAKNYVRALEHYRNAAEQRSVYAYVRLGDYYFYGLGTSIDLERAISYYQIASDMRNARAMFNLGYMHQYGLGLSKDLHLAKRYYDMALDADPDSSFLAVWLALIVLGFDFLREGDTSEWFSSFLSGGSKNTASEIGIQWDTVLIVTLIGILVICVAIRNRL